jgi:hypothetical protein
LSRTSKPVGMNCPGVFPSLEASVWKGSNLEQNLVFVQNFKFRSGPLVSLLSSLLWRVPLSCYTLTLPDTNAASPSLPFCRPVTSPPEHSRFVAPSSQVVVVSARHTPRSHAALTATATATRHPCQGARMQACKHTIECGSPTYPLPNAPLRFPPSHSRARLHFPLPPLPLSSPHRRPPATLHQSPH